MIFHIVFADWPHGFVSWLCPCTTGSIWRNYSHINIRMKICTASMKCWLAFEKDSACMTLLFGALASAAIALSIYAMAMLLLQTPIPCCYDVRIRRTVAYNIHSRVHKKTENCNLIERCWQSKQWWDWTRCATDKIHVQLYLPGCPCSWRALKRPRRMQVLPRIARNRW